MDTYFGTRCSRPAGLFSFGLLDVLQEYACVILTCEKRPAGFGLWRLATASMNSEGSL